MEPALNDVRHCCEDNNACRDTAFTEHLLTPEQFQLNNEEEAVLNPLCRTSLALEPTTTPTISLVIPLMDSVMYGLRESAPVSMLDGSGEERQPEDLHQATVQARKDMLAHLQENWVDEVDEEWLATLKATTPIQP